ncbi:MAG: MFS transporter, partial [Actinomycetota bacterium]
MGRSEGGIRTALSIRDLRVLMVGLAVSSIGDWLYGIALVVYIYELSDSATLVGIATILRLSPYILFSPLGGAIADRYSRRWVMIASDGARAVVMFGLAFAAAVDAPISIALVLTFLATALGTPYGPAFAAFLPKIVDEETLAPANALRSSIESVSLVLGPAIGGILLLLAEPWLAFTVNATSFVISVIATARVADRPVEREDEEVTGLLKQVAAGTKALLANRQIVVIVGFVAGASFLYGQELVLMVLVAEERLGMGAEGVGWLEAGVGAGGLVAMLLTGRIATTKRSESILLAAILACGLPLAALAITDSVALALLLTGFIGLGTVVLDVVSETILQRSVADNMMASIFGIIDAVAVSGMLAGSLLAPVFERSFGLEAALVIAGVFLPVVALLSLPSLLRTTKRADTRGAELAQMVTELERFEIFRTIAAPVLEGLAASATAVEVTAG